jgi:hypothetical protein
MQRLRALEGGGDKPRRMTMGQALELALTRNTGPRNEVQLTLTRDGEVQPKVTATHDDLHEAERLALDSMRRLREAFTPAAPELEPLKVEITRNAKGETQLKVAGDADRAIEWYEWARARYPLIDGTVSHDAPKPARTR